jgi:S-(hydroxymethyl)glutathione dehydrogenase / alcohol dehydrogenase
MTIRARAALLYGVNEPLRIQDVEIDEPGFGQVLVEIKAAGVCHSDLHLIEGHIPTGFPALLGHEAGGIVVRCGPGVTTLATGDHVIPLFAAECRNCPACTSGKSNLCSAKPPGFREGGFTVRGKRVHQGTIGTFATHTVVDEIALAKIRPDAPLDQAFYLGCGVTTGVGAAVFTADVKPGSRVIVFGLGGIGLNVVQGARLAGAVQIVGVDVNPGREAIGQSFGLTDFVNPKRIEGDLVAHLIGLTQGGADYVFEAIGSTALMQQAMSVTHPSWGTLIIVGLSPYGQTLEMSPWDFLLGRKVIGSWFGGARGRSDIPRLVDWFMAGRIKIKELVTHHLPFEQINEAFGLMRRGESIRTVLTF